MGCRPLLALVLLASTTASAQTTPPEQREFVFAVSGADAIGEALLQRATLRFRSRLEAAGCRFVDASAAPSRGRVRWRMTLAISRSASGSYTVRYERDGPTREAHMGFMTSRGPRDGETIEQVIDAIVDDAASLADGSCPSPPEPPPPSAASRSCQPLANSCSCVLECLWVVDGVPPISCSQACSTYRRPRLRCEDRNDRCVDAGERQVPAGRPDRDAFREGLDRVAPTARRCDGLPPGTVTIAVTIRPDGTVSVVDAAAAGAARPCVVRAFRAAVFPVFDALGGDVTVRYPVATTRP